MLKKQALIIVLILPIVMVFMAYKSGSPGGYSSSAGDKNSSCVSCHSGTPKNVSGWITTNIPTSGYIGGEVYVITLTATDPSAAKFGFELSAEDLNKNKIATFSITNPYDTKLTNSNRAVTHTSAGTTPTVNSKIWEFNWIAPEENTGSIIFSASVNAANGNGFNSGDVIYRTTSTSVSSNANFIKENTNSLRIFPNPSSGSVYIETSITAENIDILIINNAGQEVERLTIKNGLQQLDLSNLTKGLYFVKIGSEKSSEMKKLVLF